MKRKPPVPMIGRESFQVLEPLALPLRAGVPVVKLIPAGDGRDGRLLPVSRTKQSSSKASLYPTVSEFKQLPRWAKVTFLARNARRVEPLCAMMPDDWKSSHLHVVLKALEYAEQAAAMGSELDAGIMKEIRLAAKAAHLIEADAYIAVYAMQAPVSFAVDRGVGRVQYWQEANWTAAESALLQISRDPTDLRWFRRDFDLLLNLARQNHWTDESPVPLKILGSLWAKGREPAWFSDMDSFDTQRTAG